MAFEDDFKHLTQETILLGESSVSSITDFDLRALVNKKGYELFSLNQISNFYVLDIQDNTLYIPVSWIDVDGFVFTEHNDPHKLLHILKKKFASSLSHLVGLKMGLNYCFVFMNDTKINEEEAYRLFFIKSEKKLLKAG